MQLPDLNLLPPLEALLRTSSVTAAAEELLISPSAMSRTLTRLRRVLGDPLLVPAGRGLVPTPYAREIHLEVQRALNGALTALAPAAEVDLLTVTRQLTVRANDALILVLATGLLRRAATEVPGLTLRFIPEGDEDPADLRTTVDLDLGVPPELPDDVHRARLARYGYLAVGRPQVLPARLGLPRFAELPHIVDSRRGRPHSVIDDLLAAQGLSRTVLATVPSAPMACVVAAGTAAIALVPAPVAMTMADRLGLRTARIPLGLPEATSDLMWHARHHADPVHRWLRRTVGELGNEITRASRSPRPAVTAAPD